MWVFSLRIYVTDSHRMSFSHFLGSGEWQTGYNENFQEATPNVHLLGWASPCIARGDCRFCLDVGGDLCAVYFSLTYHWRIPPWCSQSGLAIRVSRLGFCCAIIAIDQQSSSISCSGRVLLRACSAGHLRPSRPSPFIAVSVLAIAWSPIILAILDGVGYFNSWWWVDEIALIVWIHSLLRMAL